MDVKRFILLYNENGTPTTFGEDTCVSDGVMSGEVDDRMLCFEGGPQAFHQCVNALLKGIAVMVMTDLRLVDGRNRFSAARLLLQLRFSDEGMNVEQLLKDFFEEYPLDKTEHLPAISQDVDRLLEADDQDPGLFPSRKYKIYWVHNSEAE